MPTKDFKMDTYKSLSNTTLSKLDDKMTGFLKNHI